MPCGTGSRQTPEPRNRDNRFNHSFPLPLEGVPASRPSLDFFVGCVARGETAGETVPGTAICCNPLQLEPLQPASLAEPAAGRRLSRETVTSVSTLHFRCPSRACRQIGRASCRERV